MKELNPLYLFTFSFLDRLENNRLPYRGSKTLLKNINRLPDREKTINDIYDFLIEQQVPESQFYRETTEILIMILKSLKLWQL